MGLLTKLLTFPIAAPGSGALWVARQIHEAAVAEITSPAEIRRTLVALERQLEAGEIDEATFEDAEMVLLQRLEGSLGGPPQ